MGKHVSASSSGDGNGSGHTAVLSQTGPRRRLYAWVSEESLDGWEGFADAHGLNVTTLAEAVGLILAKFASVEPPDMDEATQQILRLAREEGAARRRRRRD